MDFRAWMAHNEVMSVLAWVKRLRSALIDAEVHAMEVDTYEIINRSMKGRS